MTANALEKVINLIDAQNYDELLAFDLNSLGSISAIHPLAFLASNRQVFFRAIENDNDVALDWLITNSGINVNDHYRRQGNEPAFRHSLLYIALKANSQRCIVLLERRYEATLARDEEVNGLRKMIKRNDVRMVRALLDHGASVNIACNWFGRFPLHDAAMEGSTELVALLVQEYGAEVDICDTHGFTPLLATIINRPEHRHIVLQLISLGADINFKAPQTRYRTRENVLRKIFTVSVQKSVPFAQLRSFVHFLLECGFDYAAAATCGICTSLSASTRIFARRIDFNVHATCVSLNSNVNSDESPSSSLSPMPSMPTNRSLWFEESDSPLPSVLLQRQERALDLLTLSLVCGAPVGRHWVDNDETEYVYCVPPSHPISVFSEQSMYLSLLVAAANDAKNLSRQQQFSLFDHLSAVSVAPEKVREAHRRLAHERVLMIKDRATEICVALQSLRLPALITVMILDESWQVLTKLVPLHLKWKIATTIKHFRK
jgi:hypothetical protein